MDRPPISSGRGLQIELCKLVDEFKNYKLLVDGSPVEKHELAIMDLARIVQRCGINYQKKILLIKLPRLCHLDVMTQRNILLNIKNQLLL